MGFRCPNCHQDFGLDQDKLKEHFEKNPECKKFTEILFPPDDHKPNCKFGEDAKKRGCGSRSL